MKTTLEVEFCIEGSISHPDKFGWYHDQLRLSFMIKSTTKMKFDGRRLKFSVKQSSKEESRAGETSNQRSSAQVEIDCLGGNYSIGKVGGPAEVTYLASIFPPFPLLDVWDPVDGELAHISGMMSVVSIQVEGDWIIREDGNNSGTSNTTEESNERFCTYKFICRRDLKLIRKIQASLETSRKGETVMILQKLVRNFLINHSFSHMQRLQRVHPYEWNMVGRPEAPCPRPADQMIH
ncbi:hypothetical protein R1flu_026785 [Riccia fluitans]|uniref:Uncharacterized protein n=1 Tax=Riccia fluitans TaxID=41844 RepID=A0ABD1XGX1_9MARC